MMGLKLSNSEYEAAQVAGSIRESSAFLAAYRQLPKGHPRTAALRIRSGFLVQPVGNGMYRVSRPGQQLPGQPEGHTQEKSESSDLDRWNKLYGRDPSQKVELQAAEIVARMRKENERWGRR